MATVVDALVVTLGLNAVEFKKGATEANSTMESLAGAAQKVFTILGGLAVLKQAAMAYLDNADAVGKFSQALGLDVEMVQVWGNAADRAGGSADAMQGTIKSLSEELGRLKLYGMSPTLGMWQMFGVEMRDSQGQIKSVDGLLTSLAGKMEGMTQQRQVAIGKKLGLDEGTIVLLQKGKQGLEELLARQREIGVYSKQDVESARKTKAAWADLGQAWNMASGVVMRYLAPALEWLGKKLTDVAIWAREHKELMITLFTAIAGILAVVLYPVLEKMALKWLAAFAPCWAAIAIIALLGAAIAILYDDYAVWAEGGESFFGDAWGSVETFVNLTVDAFKQLGALLAIFWDFIKPLVGKQLLALLDIVKGVFQGIAGLLEWLGGVFTGDFDAMSSGGMKVLEGLGNVAKGLFLGLVQPILFVADVLKNAFTAAIDWVLAKFSALGEKWQAFKSALGFGGKEDEGGERKSILAQARDTISPASAAQSASPAAIAGATNNSKNVQASTKIDSITVNTQATDAKGIAGDIGGAVESQNLALAFDGAVY